MLGKVIKFQGHTKSRNDLNLNFSRAKMTPHPSSDLIVLSLNTYTGKFSNLIFLK